MLPIISGTTTERIVRTALVTVLINVSAVWYLRDGYVGYARDNARQLVRSLGLDDTEPLTIDAEITAAVAQRLAQTVEEGMSSDALRTAIGDPAFEHGGDTYYLGPDGHILVRWEGERLAGIEWTDGVHSETDQALQRRIGWALGVVGLVFLIQFVRVVTTRVSLTEAGLKIRGKPCIPFSAMRALRASRQGRTGCVDLDYSIDGREGVVRLDSYVVKEYEAVVAVICERTGLSKP